MLREYDYSNQSDTLKYSDYLLTVMHIIGSVGVFHVVELNI